MRAVLAIDGAITFHCFHGTNFAIMYLNYEWKLTMNESMLSSKNATPKVFSKKFFFTIHSLATHWAGVQSKSS